MKGLFMCKFDLLSVHRHGFIFIILFHMTNWGEFKKLRDL